MGRRATSRGTIGLAVEGGWDTDCNGATAARSSARMHGPRSIPAHWTAPLATACATALVGFDGPRVSELARRTLDLARGG